MAFRISPDCRRAASLFFEGGATIKIDGQNAPCRFAGESIAEHYPDRDQKALALAFPKQAVGKRGLVGWVEKPGSIRKGRRSPFRCPNNGFGRARGR
jgi:hypothetical protein